MKRLKLTVVLLSVITVITAVIAAANKNSTPKILTTVTASHAKGTAYATIEKASHKQDERKYIIIQIVRL